MGGYIKNLTSGSVYSEAGGRMPEIENRREEGHRTHIRAVI
jgi:hypothetical protein